MVFIVVLSPYIFVKQGAKSTISHMIQIILTPDIKDNI